MATRFHQSHASVLRLALALLCAASPGLLGAQDTAKAPAATAPRVNLPAGTRITRPPPSAPETVTRPPAGAAATQTGQQLVTVPDLGGATVDQARRLLAAAGLEMGAVAEGTGGGTPGTIVQQQPRAGSSVAPKSNVRLWLAPQAVAAAPPPVNRPPLTRPPAQQLPRPRVAVVPRLAGRTLDDARAALARANLQVGAVAEAAGSGAPGTIVRQSPGAGSPVAPGSGVQLWVVPARVARQPPRDTPAAPLLVRVPSVTGQSVEDARETLSGAGLALGEQAEGSGTGVPGTVARQQPAAGSAMLPNSRVRVWLVPARPVPQAEVGQVATRPDPPPARPQPRPPAQPLPPAQNPAAQNPAAQNPAAQNPAAQNPVAALPTAAVPVAADSPAVPDVRRLAFAQARDALAAAGFVAVVDAALADSAAWTVSAQQPSPGARLASGGVVALLLDPPASAPVAAAPAGQPPLAGQQQPPGQSVEPRPGLGRKLWIPLAALLLIVAAAAGAQRMRARQRVLPLAGVSARLRMDSPARVAVEGAPFGDARLRFRMNPGRTSARASAAGSLFVQKEVAGD